MLRFWRAGVDPGNAIAYIPLSARDMPHLSKGRGTKCWIGDGIFMNVGLWSRIYSTINRPITVFGCSGEKG